MIVCPVCNAAPTIHRKQRRGSYDGCSCRRLRKVFKDYGRVRHGRWMFALDWRVFVLRIVEDRLYFGRPNPGANQRWTPVRELRRPRLVEAVIHACIASQVLES